MPARDAPLPFSHPARCSWPLCTVLRNVGETLIKAQAVEKKLAAKEDLKLTVYPTLRPATDCLSILRLD